MSDFLYSSKRRPDWALGNILSSLYLGKAPACREFHGEWGSLAVFRNHYPGFAPYEDERRILAVIGGPELAWPGTSNDARDTGGNTGARCILERWLDREKMDWETDLRGPFAILCMDKAARETRVVTDPFSCIPVFRAGPENDNDDYVLGTHPDICAKAAGFQDRLDPVSAADFLMHSCVVFPYTLYAGVTQLSPGSVIRFERSGRYEEKSYWVPREKKEFASLRDAATALRESLVASVETACADCGRIGLFLSAGEDSRVILAAMPEDLPKTAFTFVESENRETRIAGEIARLYGAEHCIGIRGPDYYPDHLEACSRLAGSQSEWFSFHAIGMSEAYHLDEYGAILDGWWADSLLKGYWVCTETLSFKGVPLMASKALRNDDPRAGEKYRLFLQDRGVYSHGEIPIREDLLAAVNERVRHRLETLRELRPRSAEEWLYLWPLTQNQGSPNFLGHRRLFRHHSVFLDHRIARIGAAVPQEWKIDRRLFHTAVYPLLRKSRFVLHPSGALPRLGAGANIPVRLMVRTWWKLMKQLGIDPVPSDHPWPEWKQVADSASMRERAASLERYFSWAAPLFRNGAYDFAGRGPLPSLAYLRLLQLLACRKMVE